MKTELKTQGTVEMTQRELTEALRTYLKKEHQFDLTKAIYNIEGKSIKGVVIDVTKSEAANGNSIQDLANRKQMAFVAPSAQTSHLVGKRLKKHQRVNMGIFESLRQFFKTEKDKGTKTVNFADLYPLVRVNYPTITEKKLQVYLYDRRQLPGMDFSKVEGLIKLK